jgi:NADH-quinone oxidoreductase subunit M
MMINPEKFLLMSIGFPLILGCSLVAFGSRFSRQQVYWLAGLGFSLPFLLAMGIGYVYLNDAQFSNGYAFYSDWNTGLNTIGISLKLGLNGIALPMYLLAAVVGLAAGLYSMSRNVERMYLYSGLLMVMFAGLMGTFASVDIFFFYFFHELALIPTFIMIGIWGGRNRRTIAMELTVYLTLGAMLSLIGLIALYRESGLNSFDLISLKGYIAGNAISELIQNNIFGLLLFGFGILVSLFPFHSWAPKAYAAAPASAAMLHAGVLKKFGLYGLIQIAAPLLPAGAASWTTLLCWLAVGNILFIGFVTMAQKDLKQMIGFSSVMHMGYCFLGIATFSSIGVGGAVVLMFGHGLSVALLFMLSNMIQERTATSEMSSMGGLSQEAPVLCAFFLFAMLANIGLPGFANFWGEVSVFISLWNLSPWFLAIAVSGVVISAIYGLRAVANVFFGEKSESATDAEDLKRSERVPALILAVALLAVGFWPQMITTPINQSLQKENAALIAKN